MDSNPSVVSFWVCIGMSFIILLFFFIIVMLTILSLKIEISKWRWLYKELFNGIKDAKYAKFYTVIFLFVRICSVLVTIILQNDLFELKMSIFGLIHFCNLAFLFMCPFESTKDNIIENVNQISYFLAILPLTHLRDESQWKDYDETVYLYLLMTGPVVGFIIILTDLIIKIYK